MILRGKLLRRVLFWIIMNLTFIDTFSQESVGLEYENLNIGFNSYDATLSNSEKVTPIYTELKYSFNKEGRVSPFIKGDFGFNYVSDEIDESDSAQEEKLLRMTENSYSSIGVGADIGEQLSMEAAYTNYQIAVEEREDKFSENRVMLKLKYRY